MSAASKILSDSSIRWHQKFSIGGELTPGVNDISIFFAKSEIPANLTGKSVIDIGTTNGAAAFECYARGASKVLAVDICDPEVFGFNKIKNYLGYEVEFLQSSVYDLPANLMGETYDYVIFWGVLYHLRHPALGLDAVYQISRNFVSIETAVNEKTGSTFDFYKGSEFNNDASNWWVPSVSGASELIASAGFNIFAQEEWGSGPGKRYLCEAISNNGLNQKPLFMENSYEKQINSLVYTDRIPGRYA